ncbi:hypothetical protein ACOSQ4_012400 [Xanthoceras sorbifolium]
MNVAKNQKNEITSPYGPWLMVSYDKSGRNRTGNKDTRNATPLFFKGGKKDAGVTTGSNPSSFKNNKGMKNVEQESSNCNLEGSVMAMSRFQVLKDLEEETDGTSKGFKAGSTTKNPNVKHKAILKDNTNIHEDGNTNKDSTDNRKGNDAGIKSPLQNSTPVKAAYKPSSNFEEKMQVDPSYGDSPMQIAMIEEYD